MLRILFLCLLLSCTNLLLAAPAPVSIEDRVRQADLVLVAQVEEVQLANFNRVSKHASLHLRTLETLKGEAAPKEFDLAFLVFPETVENHLREPVPKGRYIVFLRKKRIASTGKEVLILLEPRTFAFVDYRAEIVKQIRSILSAAILQRQASVGSRLPSPPPLEPTRVTGNGFLSSKNEL